MITIIGTLLIFNYTQLCRLKNVKFNKLKNNILINVKTIFVHCGLLSVRFIALFHIRLDTIHLIYSSPDTHFFFILNQMIHIEV